MNVTVQTATLSGTHNIGTGTLGFANSGTISAVRLGMRVAGPGIPQNATVQTINGSSITLSGTVNFAMANGATIFFGTLQPVSSVELQTPMLTNITLSGTPFTPRTYSAYYPMTTLGTLGGEPLQITGVVNNTVTISAALPAAVSGGSFRVAGYIPIPKVHDPSPSPSPSSFTVNPGSNSLTFKGDSGLSPGMVVGGGTNASGVQDVPNGTFVQEVFPLNIVTGTQLVVLNGTLNTIAPAGSLTFATFPHRVAGPAVIRGNSRDLFVQDNIAFGVGMPLVGRIKWWNENALNMVTVEGQNRLLPNIVGLNISKTTATAVPARRRRRRLGAQRWEHGAQPRQPGDDGAAQGEET